MSIREGDSHNVFAIKLDISDNLIIDLTQILGRYHILEKEM